MRVENSSPNANAPLLRGEIHHPFGDVLRIYWIPWEGYRVTRQAPDGPERTAPHLLSANRVPLLTQAIEWVRANLPEGY